ncbi:MAG: hypothetical protein P8N02_19200, partial [Actinomycetota bacterium]|nr:hypothetical protein [Actinomycetota bacterium]
AAGPGSPSAEAEHRAICSFGGSYGGDTLSTSASSEGIDREVPPTATEPGTTESGETRQADTKSEVALEGMSSADVPRGWHLDFDAEKLLSRPIDFGSAPTIPLTFEADRVETLASWRAITGSGEVSVFRIENPLWMPQSEQLMIDVDVSLGGWADGPATPARISSHPSLRLTGTPESGPFSVDVVSVVDELFLIIARAEAEFDTTWADAQVLRDSLAFDHVPQLTHRAPVRVSAGGEDPPPFAVIQDVPANWVSSPDPGALTVQSPDGSQGIRLLWLGAQDPRAVADAVIAQSGPDAEEKSEVRFGNELIVLTSPFKIIVVADIADFVVVWSATDTSPEPDLDLLEAIFQSLDFVPD